jgi:signal peptidase II
VKRHLWVFSFVLLACVGCDHAAKHVAEQWLGETGGVALLGGIVRFQLVANPGAFLSLGEHLPETIRHLVLIGFVPLMLVSIGWLLFRSPHATRGQIVAFGLIAGGGLANWLDRVRDDGAVTDFVSLGLGQLRTGIFNVADLAIVAGLCVFLLVGAGRAREEAAAE